jgi:hypothetical protein
MRAQHWICPVDCISVSRSLSQSLAPLPIFLRRNAGFATAAARPTESCTARYSTRFKNNCFEVMISSFEEGSCSRLVDFLYHSRPRVIKKKKRQDLVAGRPRHFLEAPGGSKARCSVVNHNLPRRRVGVPSQYLRNTLTLSLTLTPTLTLTHSLTHSHPQPQSHSQSHSRAFVLTT